MTKFQVDDRVVIKKGEVSPNLSGKSGTIKQILESRNGSNTLYLLFFDADQGVEAGYADYGIWTIASQLEILNDTRMVMY